MLTRQVGTAKQPYKYPNYKGKLREPEFLAENVMWFVPKQNP